MVWRIVLFTAAALAFVPMGAQGRSRSGDNGGVPNLDVKSSCSDAQKFSTGSGDKDVAYKGCMQDEMNAKSDLGKRWSEFKSKDKRDCVEQSRNPSPSYVEVLTCLEMNSDTRGAPKLKPGMPVGGPTAPGAIPGAVPGASPGPRT